MRILGTIICLLTISFFASNALAWTGTGTSAASFLNIGVSARSAATGGAYSAISDGPVSSYYNPAGLAVSDNMQIAGMHSEWLDDLRYEYLGFAAPVGSRGGMGISFSYLSYGNFQGYDNSGQPTGSVSAYDLAATLSYGHRITNGLSLGIGLKTVGEKLDNVQAFGIAGDFGAQYNFGRILAGVSIMNFGPKLKYETSSSPLPTTVNAGLSFIPFSYDLSVLAGTAILFTGDYSFRGGIEYTYDNLLILRTGYDSESNFDARSGFFFFFGLKLSVHSLDYAYNINSLFGGTHQISFVYRFGDQRIPSHSESETRPILPAPVQAATVTRESTPEPADIDATESDTEITNDLVTPAPVQVALIEPENVAKPVGSDISPESESPRADLITVPALRQDKIKPVGVDVTAGANIEPEPIAKEPDIIEKPTVQLPAQPAIVRPEIAAGAVTRELEPVAARKKVNSGKVKYIVCAGKYSDRGSAVKHIRTLKLFDVSARLIDKGDEQYRVVLKEVKGQKKAEKSRRDFEKKGIACFIEEL